MLQKFGFVCNDGDVPGVRLEEKGGGNAQANVSIRVPYPLVQDHPEATGRDEIKCGQCGNYLKNSRVNIW